MNKLDRGLKHVCSNCAMKYYDLNKETAVCPGCGTRPPAAKVPKTTEPAKKSGRSTYWRYP